MCTSASHFPPVGLRFALVICISAGLGSCGGSGEVPIAAGKLELVAGTPDEGGAGNRDGAGTAARFSQPMGLALDVDGNLYVADAGNATVRKITPGGMVSKLANMGLRPDLNYPQQVAVAADGSVLFSWRQTDPQSDNGAQSAWVVRRVDSLGRLSTAIDPLLATGLAVPGKARTIGSMQFDRQGRLVLSDYFGCEVGRADTALSFSTLLSIHVAYGDSRCGGFGTATYGLMAMALDKDDRVYFATADGALWRSSADGEATALYRPTVRPDRASGMAVDEMGRVYVSRGEFVQRLDPDGTVAVLAGVANESGSADGPGEQARFDSLGGLVADRAGNVFVTDTNQHTVRKIDPTGRVTTLAGLATQYRHADGMGAQARFGESGWLTADADGSLWVADGSTMTLRKIDRQGHVTTLAGKPGVYGSTDGPAALARFSSPIAVAVFGGKVVVGEGLRLRWVDAQGQVVSTAWPLGVVDHLAASASSAASASGVLVAASSSFTLQANAPGAEGSLCTSPRRRPSRTSFWINQVAADGSVTTGFNESSHPDLQAASRSCLAPEGLAVDGQGSVYFTLGHAVFKRTRAGALDRLAGQLDTPGSADGGAAEARFNAPRGLAVAADGTLYVADSGNHTVRKIAPSGAVSTTVGRAGQPGIVLGALPAGLDSPYNVAVTPQGLVVRSKTAVLLAPL